MIPLKITHTPFGPVTLFREDVGDYYVKSGSEWATYVAGNAGYSKTPCKMNYMQATKIFDAAVYDSEMIYQATRRREA